MEVQPSHWLDDAPVLAERSPVVPAHAALAEDSVSGGLRTELERRPQLEVDRHKLVLTAKSAMR